MRKLKPWLLYNLHIPGSYIIKWSWLSVFESYKKFISRPQYAWNYLVCMKCLPDTSEGMSFLTFSKCWACRHRVIQWILQLRITDRTLYNSLSLQAFMVLHKKWQTSRTYEKKILRKNCLTFTPPHTWPITVGSGCDCWIVGFTSFEAYWDLKLLCCWEHPRV